MPSKPQSPEEALSRALSRTLRHVARQQGIPQDDAGWCKIADILAKPPYTNMDVATEENILRAVDDNKKKRYELNADKTAIRAVQGHSVAVDVDMAPVTRDTLPPVLVHGTNAAAWPLIREHGLNRMKRLHVHLAPGLPGRDGAQTGPRLGRREAQTEVPRRALHAREVGLGADGHAGLQPQRLQRLDAARHQQQIASARREQARELDTQSA